MKRLLTSLFLMGVLWLNAQENMPSSFFAHSENIEFNGGKYRGMTTDFLGGPDLVEDAVREKFSGHHPKKIKGFLVYRRVLIPEIDPVDPVDVFINVDRKSRKERDISVVSLIAAKPGQISDDKVKGAPPAGVALLTQTQDFFNALEPMVQLKVYERSLVDQEEIIAKAEKKLKDLQDDQISLEKKIKGLEDDLENNKKDQETQASEVERQKAALADLLSKRPADRKM